MRQSESINDLAKALVAVQAELQPVLKDSTNPHFKNSYASLDATMGYVRPVLARQSLAIVQGGSKSPAGVCVTTMLLHASGQWIAFDYLMPLEKATAQSVGSAITYGRRYGLGSILALATEDDDDGQAASQTRRAVKPAKLPKASDEQIQRIQELADATGDLDKVKSRLSTLDAEEANTWIAKLQAKYTRTAQA
jgi:hypothetical protein